jgi:hypothetical protein
MARSAKRNQGWNILTFDRMIAGEIILVIYWAGLGVIALAGFGMVGAGVGFGMRDPSLNGLMVAGPLLVGGLLVIIVLTLVWRAICEFYIAIFRISEDLRALRRNDEAALAAARPAPQMAQPVRAPTPAPAPAASPVNAPLASPAVTPASSSVSTAVATSVSAPLAAPAAPSVSTSLPPPSYDTF